ncbi:MAG: PD40 domain-containing protein [Deltaproteobacteria bacterium]|nr:PD40 domain-containing protein [Deltaproteobacteria bacterium]
MFPLLLSLLAQPALAVDTTTATATPYLAAAQAEDGHEVSPSWLPNGSHLAYRLDRPDGSSCAKMVSVDGSAPGPVQTVVLPGGAFAAGLTCRVESIGWHPDGILILSASNQGGPTRLYITQPGGEDTAASSELLSIEQAPGQLVSPATARSAGHVVAFIARTGQSADVYAWTPGSDLPTQVTHTAAVEEAVAVNATGDRIAFVSATFDQGEHLLLYDLELAGDETSDADEGSKKKKKKKKKASEEASEEVVRIAGASERARIRLTGDVARPTWAGGDVLFFMEWEERWQMRRLTSELSSETVFDDLELPQNAPPAVTADGQWAAWTRQNSDAVYFGNRDRSKLIEVHTGLEGLTDPALVRLDARTLAAFSAYGEGGSFRGLYIMDVTAALGE